MMCYYLNVQFQGQRVNDFVIWKKLIILWRPDPIEYIWLDMSCTTRRARGGLAKCWSWNL